MNNTVTESIPQPTDRNDEPVHDGYPNISGPTPFRPGTEQYRRFQAEIRQLRQNTENRRKTALEQEFVPVSLYEENRKEKSGQLDQCPRATRRFIEDGDSTLAVWLPCDSRTCGYCKDAIDERDAARLAYSLREAPTLYLTTIPVASWDRIRKRAHRAGAVAVKMGSSTAHDLIEVVSSEPLTDHTHVAGMGEIVRRIRERPPGSPPAAKGKQRGRSEVHFTGPGLVTVKEWETMERGPKVDRTESRTFDMHSTVRVEEVVIVAEILKIPVKVERDYQIRLRAHWDDPRMVGLRAWASQPRGRDTWSQMLAEAEYEQGVLLEEPPMEVHEAELEEEVA